MKRAMKVTCILRRDGGTSEGNMFMETDPGVNDYMFAVTIQNAILCRSSRRNEHTDGNLANAEPK